MRLLADTGVPPPPAVSLRMNGPAETLWQRFARVALLIPEI